MQPPVNGDSYDPKTLLQHIQDQTTTRRHWQAHLVDALDNALREIQRLRALVVAQQHALAINPEDMPPEQLLDAWRTQMHRDRPVTVEIDGTPVTLMVAAEARSSDPLREVRDWQAIVSTFRHVRADIRRAS